MVVGTDILRHESAYIADMAILGTAKIAIAHHRDEPVISQVDDAMKDEMPRENLCQHGIANMQLVEGVKRHLVAHVLQERSHAIALDGHGDGVTIGDELSDQW